MIDALLLTICICSIAYGIAFFKTEHDFNRDMQRILPRKERYSTMETPFFSDGPHTPTPHSDR